MIRLGLILSLLGSLYFLAACDDDHIPGVPDVNVPSTSTSYKPKPFTPNIDSDLSDLKLGDPDKYYSHGYDNAEYLAFLILIDFEKDGSKIQNAGKDRDNKLKKLNAKTDPQYQAIETRIKELDIKAKALIKTKDMIAHAKKFHEQKWPKQSDKQHQEFGLKMSKETLNYYITFTEAFLFFESIEPGLSSDEYKKMANDIAHSIDDEEVVRNMWSMVKFEKTQPFTRWTRLATFEQVYFYSIEKRGSNHYTGITTAESFWKAKEDDDVLFLTWLRFEDLFRKKFQGLTIPASTHLQVSKKGYSHYALFRQVTQFAEVVRGENSGSEINEPSSKFKFAQEIANRGGDFFQSYQVYYSFAKTDSKLRKKATTDELRHEYAMKKAEKEIKEKQKN